MTRSGWVLANLLLSIVLGGAALLAGQAPKQAAVRQHADVRAAAEEKIRALDAEWVKAVAAKDLEKATSYYADDGSVMAPGAPIATGKEAIRKAWGGMLELPGFALTFSPTKIDAAKSLEMAYEIGTYQLTVNDKDGKPQTQPGKYVVVWKKQADGSWKVVADIFNSDQ